MLDIVYKKHFLNKFLECLKSRKVPYAISASYISNPFDARDLDLFIPAQLHSSATQILSTLLSGTDLYIYKISRNFYSYQIYIKIIGSHSDCIQIDLVSCISFSFFVLLKSSAIVEHYSFECNGYTWIHPKLYDDYLLLRKFFFCKQLTRHEIKRSVNVIRIISQQSDCRVLLYTIRFLTPLVYLVNPQIFSGIAAISSPVQLSHVIYCRIILLLSHLFSPTIKVCVLGLDGSGKSTLINNIVDNLPNARPFYLFKYGTFSKTNYKSNPTPYLTRRLSHPWLAFKYILWTARFLLTFTHISFFSRLPSRLNIEIYDRGFLDMFHQPIRYGLLHREIRYFKRLIVKLYDLQVFMKVPPPICYSRKPEFEIEIGHKLYRRYAHKLSRHLLVISDQHYKQQAVIALQMLSEIYLKKFPPIVF